MNANVTPTLTLTTTENGSSVTLLYPCQATKTDGCYVKKSSGSISGHSSKSSLWMLLFALLTLGVTVLAETVPIEEIASFDNLTIAIDTLANTTGVGTDHVVLIDGQLVGISDFVVTPPSRWSKRWNEHNAPLGASWTNYRLVQQNLSWTEWQAATCVAENPKNENSTVLLVSKFVIDGYWIEGFNWDFAKSTVSALGVKITKHVEISSTDWYTIPANGTGQAFVQQQYVYQEQQSQKCHKRHYGKGGIKCDGWLGPFSAKIPVYRSNNYGYSTGREHMQFGACGGRLSY